MTEQEFFIQAITNTFYADSEQDASHLFAYLCHYGYIENSSTQVTTEREVPKYGLLEINPDMQLRRMSVKKPYELVISRPIVRLLCLRQEDETRKLAVLSPRIPEAIGYEPGHQFYIDERYI